MVNELEAVKASIFKYLAHLHDYDYMAAIATSMPLSEFSNTLSLLLQLEDDETVGLTTLFITDLVMAGSHHPQCTEFSEQYPNSVVVKTLEQMASSPYHYICTVAVYTLGKNCSYGSVDAISQAFCKLRDVAPLALPRLIGEMGWLGAENFWELLESMISSPIYATRWAVLDILHEFIGDEPKQEDKLFQHKCRFVEKLRQDSSMYVRLEAEYDYQLLKFRSESYELPKAERKKNLKSLQHRYQPALCFAEISHKFIQDMHNKGLKKYSVSELESFIDELYLSRL